MTPSNRSKNIVVCAVSVLLVVSADRVLLKHYGLPLWEWDKDLHYKHRANIKARWSADFGFREIRMNSYGQHDDDYPVQKPQGELRILNLGDSITMGHGVSRDETYSKYLEDFLRRECVRFTEFQAINGGVQGYGTFQELELLRRDMIFRPDCVTIGFCLNDFTEPFAVDRHLGGIGLDYHRVAQVPNAFMSLLANETGFGRMIQEIRISFLDARQEKLGEVIDVKRMVLDRDAEYSLPRRQAVLDCLHEIYSICRSNDLDVILLLFPFTFQFESQAWGWPQELLESHARDHGVESINYLSVFSQLIDETGGSVRKYFLDDDHLTAEGHRVVARILGEHIRSMLCLPRS